MRLAQTLNLSSYATATLTFDWLIESSFDTGEYVSLDVSANGGTTWTSDVRRLRGNVNSENVWLSETVDLTPFKSASVLIRFRSLVSDSTEDANIDNVRIVGNGSSSSAALALASAGQLPDPRGSNSDGEATAQASSAGEPLRLRHRMRALATDEVLSQLMPVSHEPDSFDNSFPIPSRIVDDAILATEDGWELTDGLSRRSRRLA